MVADRRPEMFIELKRSMAPGSVICCDFIGPANCGPPAGVRERTTAPPAKMPVWERTVAKMPAITRSFPSAPLDVSVHTLVAGPAW